MLCYTVGFGCMLFVLYDAFEKMKIRLQDVTNALLIAEFHTGVPYYTSLKTTPYHFDKSEWLYEHQRKKIQKRGNFVYPTGHSSTVGKN